MAFCAPFWGVLLMLLGEAQRREAEAELADLLRWEEIGRSPQLAGFLKYVVKATLDGEEQNIKAYAIAVDVFGRATSFDPQSDPIVRVQARRLRSLLERYYESGLSGNSVHIRLPVGRYVPEFDVVGATETAGPVPIEPAMAIEPMPVASKLPVGSAPRSRAVLTMRLGVGLVALLLISAAIGLEHGWFRPNDTGLPLPLAPILAIGTFGNMTGDAGFNGIAAGLGGAIATDLGRFDLISLTVADATTTPAEAAPLILTGFVSRSGAGLEFDAVLVGPTGASAWATSIEESLSPGGDHVPVVGDAALTIATRLAVYHGPLYAAGRAWLDKHNGLEDQPSLYTCMLRFYRVAESWLGSDEAQAIGCFQKLLKTTAPSPLAVAALSRLQATTLLEQARAGDNLTTLLQPPLDAARQSSALAPNNSFVHQQLAQVLDAALLRAEAKQEFAKALQLNPGNLDARAAYAQTLGLDGDWSAAAEEAAAALRASPSPPPWYYETLMLDDYRQNNYGAAIDAALIYATTSHDLPVALALAAAGESKRRDIIDQFMRGLMTNAGYRSAGILPKLGLRITDPSLLHHIAEGLVLAGVPPSALSQPF
jgi:tetratricopeptide (TPR) repeat protein